MAKMNISVASSRFSLSRLFLSMPIATRNLEHQSINRIIGLRDWLVILGLWDFVGSGLMRDT